MMQGLALSHRFWEEVARPKIETDLPDVLPHLAAGLCGEGSECFSFDDAISRDHDWAPASCSFLRKRTPPNGKNGFVSSMHPFPKASFACRLGGNWTVLRELASLL